MHLLQLHQLFVNPKNFLAINLEDEAADYGLVEHGVCLWRVEDEVELAHVLKDPVECLHVHCTRARRVAAKRASDIERGTFLLKSESTSSIGTDRTRHPPK